MAYISFKPKDYFNTVLYTGNGSDAHGITGVGFQPDWVWTKIRSGADNHGLYDVVRGVNKNLQTNSNYAEQSYSTLLQSFDSDGFTIGTNGEINGNSSTFVSWNWKAGNSSGSSNSDGSVTSTVSVNTTAGFSIVKYTNPSSGSPFTVGHGLGAAPKLIIFKDYSNASNWGVWTSGIGTGKYLILNNNNAEAAANLVTATSTTTFSTYYDHFSNGASIIAYCFAEVTGFFKTGIYFGNGNADGSFIYTGFKPAFVIIKQETGTQGWMMHDNKRNNPSALLGNTVDATLYPSQTAAEATSGFDIDFYSNGFKPRNTDAAHNANNNSYVYWAFAEEPLVSSNNIPATAR